MEYLRALPCFQVRILGTGKALKPGAQMHVGGGGFQSGRPGRYGDNQDVAMFITHMLGVYMCNGRTTCALCSMHSTIASRF